MAAAISGNGDQRGEERAVSQAMRPLRDDANSKVWMVKWACESKKLGVSRRKEERWRARGVPIQRAQPPGGAHVTSRGKSRVEAEPGRTAQARQGRRELRSMNSLQGEGTVCPQLSPCQRGTPLTQQRESWLRAGFLPEELRSPTRDKA